MSALNHFVTIDLDQGYYGDRPSMTCKAPADALCHAVWSCDCESWFKQGVQDGKPWHIPGDYSEDLQERHVGRLDPNECNLVDWANNSDECLRGTITLPVTAEHHGDHVIFHAAPGAVEVNA